MMLLLWWAVNHNLKTGVLTIFKVYHWIIKRKNILNPLRNTDASPTTYNNPQNPDIGSIFWILSHVLSPCYMQYCVILDSGISKSNIVIYFHIWQISIHIVMCHQLQIYKTLNWGKWKSAGPCGCSAKPNWSFVINTSNRKFVEIISDIVSRDIPVSPPEELSTNECISQ